MPKIPLNGTELFYKREGSGPRKFLLFNGGIRWDIERWGNVAERLGNIGEVIRFDYRDFGKTAIAKEPYSLETLAEDASALLAYLGIDRAIVIGHALGGRIAQVFVRDYPEKASALIICGTGGLFPPNLPEIEKSSEADWFFITNFGSKFRNKYPERAQGLFEEYRWQAVNPGALERLAQAIQEMPTNTYWGKIPLSVPALLLYGTEDCFGTPENARDLHQRLEGSRLIFIDGAGHYIIREEPDRIFEEIKKFVKDKKL